MLKNKSIGVVVPTYNEEKLIGKVLSTMPDFVDYIIVIDDASKDKTATIVKKYRQKNRRIILIKHKKNQGVGGAIASGYIWARNHGLSAVAVMAGDAQMDPKDLSLLLKPVINGEVDYAKGNRLLSGEAFKKIPRSRYLGNSVLSLLTKIASGYWHIADSQSGYTVIGKKALRTIDWSKMYKKYGQPNDLLVRLNIYNFKVRDIPIRPVYNIGEKSGIKIHIAIFTVGWLLFRLFIWRIKEKYIIRDFHPLVFFYFLGSILSTVTMFLLIRLIWLWVVDGFVPQITALALVFSVVAGLQSIFFAMWFDMESNKHLR